MKSTLFGCPGGWLTSFVGVSGDPGSVVDGIGFGDTDSVEDVDDVDDVNAVDEAAVAEGSGENMPETVGGA